MPDSPQDKNQEVRTEWQAAGDLGPDRLFHGSSDGRGAGWRGVPLQDLFICFSDILRIQICR